MILKRFAWILPSVLVSCARPNYQSASPPQPKTLAQTSNRCDLSNPCAIRFIATNVCASLALKTPVRTDGNESTGILTLTQPLLPPLKWAADRLVMPAHGHFSAHPVIEKIDDLHYRLRHLFFFMAGDWEMTLRLENGANDADKAVVTFCL